MLGSPPRVRGKGLLSKKCLLRVGITPACAGKRCGARLAAGHRRDHPRVCGEKLALNVIPNSIKGSPPRVRGKVITYQLTPERSGITPACAGKRGSGFSLRHQSEDHPRVCGEKGHPFRIPTAPPGSPPRVRGKAEPLAVDGDITGITPACAGKRVFPGTHIPAVWDHPRVCGEKDIRHHGRDRHGGSPPRVRGKASAAPRIAAVQRITPACAGKSCTRSHAFNVSWDHPRVCGEK